MVVGPPCAHGMRWSRSQLRAGIRQPGKIQVRWRASTTRRMEVVGRRWVVPTWIGIPDSGCLTTYRHSASCWWAATWRAISATTGPYPESSPECCVNPARVSRSTWRSTTPWSLPVPVTVLPLSRSRNTSARNWSTVLVSPVVWRLRAMRLMRRVAAATRSGGSSRPNRLAVPSAVAWGTTRRRSIAA